LRLALLLQFARAAGQTGIFFTGTLRAKRRRDEHEAYCDANPAECGATTA
jgi:hypothetical protein